MVIPNKIYQAAQAGCPVVTLDTPAIREIFVPGESLMTIASSSDALVATLRSLAEDPAVGREMARTAAAEVLVSAGPQVRAQRWRQTLSFGSAEAPTPA